MKRLGQFLVFLLISPLILLVSLMPFGVLYFFSDVLCLVMYKLIGYRKAVVRYNLQMAFPEKSKEELLELEKKFYCHLSDLFMEMIKSFSISARKLRPHFRIENPEVMNALFDQGKPVIIYGGHQGNWEWVIAVKDQIKHRPMAVYKKLSNPYINRFMLKTRTKFGFDFVPTFLAKKYMKRMQENGERVAYGFLGDQNPLPHKAKFWYPFFGHKVPVYTGAEELAKQYDIPLVFMQITKEKRGYYKAKLIPLALSPREFPDYQITERYFYLLEESIQKQPEIYYWIHRRFKHAKD